MKKEYRPSQGRAEVKPSPAETASQPAPRTDAAFAAPGSYLHALAAIQRAELPAAASEPARLPARVPEPEPLPSVGGPPIQALMSLEAFQEATDFKEWRVTISAVDSALKAVHKADISKRQKALEKLVQATDYYLKNKPDDHKRAAPTRALRAEALDELYAFAHKAAPEAVPDAGYAKKMYMAGRQNDEDVINTVTAYCQYPVVAQQCYILCDLSSEQPAYLEALKHHGTLLEAMQHPVFADLLFRIIHDVGELATCINEVKFLNVAVRHSFGWGRKGGTLRPYQRAMLGILVDKATTVDELKRLVHLRFGLDVDKITALGEGEHNPGKADIKKDEVKDWTVPGLRKAFHVMETLPPGHAEDNPMFQQLLRFQGVSGWFGGDTQKIAVGYYDDHLDLTHSEEDPGAFAGKDIFSQIVRHEVGHAVDARIGPLGSAGYCKLPKGGGWEQYESLPDMTMHVFEKTNSHMIRFLKGLNDYEGDKDLFLAELSRTLFHKDARPDDLLFVLDLYLRKGSASWGEKEPKEKQEIVEKLLTDPGFALMGQDFEAPWKTGKGVALNGRTYVQYRSGFASFLAESRARQVSNYQYRAPGEWFAEAYAAYYQPNNNGIGHGDALADRDPTTWYHMKTKVDKALG